MHPATPFAYHFGASVSGSTFVMVQCPTWVEAMELASKLNGRSKVRRRKDGNWCVVWGLVQLLIHLRVLGLDLLELTVVTDAESDEASIEGLGTVESLHVAEGEPLGEVGFTR